MNLQKTMPFDFRKFHVRSINAASDAERQAINQELKAVYAALDETEKVQFNEELQRFLVGQYKTLSDDYQAVKNSGGLN